MLEITLSDLKRPSALDLREGRSNHRGSRRQWNLEKDPLTTSTACRYTLHTYCRPLAPQNTALPVKRRESVQSRSLLAVLQGHLTLILHHWDYEEHIYTLQQEQESIFPSTACLI
jgi:hypothetical protein